MKRMNEEKPNQMAEFIHRYVRENNGESPKFKDILEYMEMSNSVGYRYLTTLRDRAHSRAGLHGTYISLRALQHNACSN